MLCFDPLYQKYPSRRTAIYARGGMVNCSSPLAAAAGLELLRRGGNAIDAAVAAAAALTVVEPTANSLGSDAFALVWSERKKKLFGLNSSGPAPMLASAEGVLADGKDQKRKDAGSRLDAGHRARGAGGLGGAVKALRPRGPVRGACACRSICAGGLSLCAASRPRLAAVL